MADLGGVTESYGLKANIRMFATLNFRMRDPLYRRSYKYLGTGITFEGKTIGKSAI